MKNPIVYISAHCPYCPKVQNFASENNIEVEYKNRDDSAIRDELIDIAWKAQVPFLIDANQDLQMHESDDIITHLRKHYT